MSKDESIEAIGRRLSMYAILPSIFQLPIPLLAFVRRRICDHGLRSREPVSGLAVPRTLGNDDLELEGCLTEVAVSDKTETVDTGKEHAFEDSPRYDLHFQKSSPAQIGSHLLNAAMIQSQQQDPQSQAFSRQLYINGLAYLLQGLPEDLTEQEFHQLQSVLPQSLDRPSHLDNAPYRSRNPSILHRSVATVVVFFCLLLRLALPFVKSFIAIASTYERSNHITENCLALSLSSLNYFGKFGMDVAALAMNNKPVVEVFTYCVEGICGGVNEGLGECIRIIDPPNRP